MGEDALAFTIEISIDELVEQNAQNAWRAAAAAPWISPMTCEINGATAQATPRLRLALLPELGCGTADSLGLGSTYGSSGTLIGTFLYDSPQ